VDPLYPAPIIDRCSAAKKKCMVTLAHGLLNCQARSMARNIPLDPACLAKVLLKFNGGPLPARGCFEKVEAKFPGACQTEDDTSALESAATAFAQDVACDLDPYQAACSTCGNNIAESPPEDCDGTDDAACTGACTVACNCP
jgi:hypothetical protein